MRIGLLALTAALASQSTIASAQTHLSAPAVPPADAANNETSKDIVVTASKIGGNLDKAPIAGVALGADVLARLNVESVRDAQIALPSVVYDTSAGSAQVYIRGIGTNSAYAGLESSIGTYQDGVYLQRQVGASLDVVDLANIEVLNGPQGSLYGRNATGGVILVTTKDPVDRLAASAQVGVASFNTFSGEGMINLPIASDLALRVAGRYETSEGYVRNLANGAELGGDKNGTIRGKLGWHPAGGFSAVLAVEHGHDSADPVARRLLVGAPECTACLIYGQSVSANSPFYKVDQTPTAKTVIDYTAETLNLRYDTTRFSVISVSGYRDFDYRVHVDQDFAAGDLFRTTAEETGHTFTNDTYLRSKLRGVFNMLIGASGEIDHDTLLGQFYGDAFGPYQGGTNVSAVELRSISPYAEAYVTPIARVKLTLGARYNIDQKTLDATNDATVQATLGASPLVHQRATFRNFTPRAVLSYETSTTTLYASIGKGAKSGGFNTPALAPQVPLQPEKLTSYELGAKVSLLHNRVNLQGAGFYYDYKDMQVSFIDATSGGVVAENAANARIYGLELSATVKPTARLTLHGGTTLLNAKFKSYPSAAVFCPADMAEPNYPGCPAPTGGPGLVNGVANLGGTRLPRAPGLSFAVSADYTFVVTPGYEMTLTVADRYTGDYDFLAGGGGPLDLSRQSAYHMVTASATLLRRPSGLKLRAFVQNLANAKYYLDLPTSTFGVAGSAAPPRSYGMSVGFQF